MSWSYDFVEDRTHDGRKYRMLNVLDEFTHECLAIRVARKLKAIDVIDVLSDLFILRGIPAYIRSDNGPEFVAKAVQEWIAVVGAKTAYIERGSPWENGYIESCSPSRRAARRRNLLHSPRGPNRHRELAAPLQHDQAARIARIQAACTGGICSCLRRVAGCATPTGSAGHAGATANLKLTFHLDHPVGANQRLSSGSCSINVRCFA
jgi:transposase InsO family protein